MRSEEKHWIGMANIRDKKSNAKLHTNMIKIKILKKTTITRINDYNTVLEFNIMIFDRKIFKTSILIFSFTI